ncbi:MULTISPECIES: hypothetical protein [unclassified Tychonema]|nr:MULTISPECIES: hypothetical protein [unclassified Tychonema]
MSIIIARIYLSFNVTENSIAPNLLTLRIGRSTPATGRQNLP